MKLGCSIPAKTFMPEFKGSAAEDNSLEDLLEKCRYACGIGYDYVELSVGAVNELTDAQADILSSAVKNGEFNLFCCNSFVPPEIKICTENFGTVTAFVKKTMRRLNRIGVTEVVFGSGYARKRPDTVSVEDADKRIEEFLLLCSDEGNKYGITVCVEPLNSTETNVINKATDGACLVRKLGKANIKLLPDLFHMCIEKEDPAVLVGMADITAHLHASEAPGRVFPGKYGGEYLKRAAKFFKECGSPAVTVECVFDDFKTEAKLSYDFMRGLL